MITHADCGGRVLLVETGSIRTDVHYDVGTGDVEEDHDLYSCSPDGGDSYYECYRCDQKWDCLTDDDGNLLAAFVGAEKSVAQ